MEHKETERLTEDQQLVMDLVREHRGQPFEIIDLLMADGWQRGEARRMVAWAIDRRWREEGAS